MQKSSLTLDCGRDDGCRPERPLARAIYAGALNAEPEVILSDPWGRGAQPNARGVQL